MRAEAIERNVQPVLDHWDAKKWRAPDDKDDQSMIWYGPGGRDGENATEISWSGHAYQIREYIYVRDQIDDPDEDFLSVTVIVSFDEFAIAVALVDKRRLNPERLADAMKSDPDRLAARFARIAVGYGVAKIQYWGGEEDFVDSLP